MAKQWLNEYSTGLSGNSRQIARLRQLRLNGLRRWHVKEIVAVLPVLLQVASALFFAGLLVLLWQLNRVVAIVATALVGLLFIFSLSTIILPSIAPGCAYLSPPSRALYAFTPLLRNLIYDFSIIMLWCYVEISALFKSGGSDEVFDEHPRISDIADTLVDMFEVSGLKWHGRELHVLAQESDELDADSVETAYTSGMDTKYLHHASVCITELTLDTARKCIRKIRFANIAHWGEDNHTTAMESVEPCIWSGAIIALTDAVSQDDPLISLSITKELEDMYDSVRLYHQDMSSALAHTRLVRIDIARIIRYNHLTRQHPGTLNSVMKIHESSLRRWVIYLSGQCLGNDIRHQCECTPV